MNKSQEQITNIYETVPRPVLEYASTIWSPWLNRCIVELPYLTQDMYLRLGSMPRVCQISEERRNRAQLGENIGPTGTRIITAKPRQNIELSSERTTRGQEYIHRKNETRRKSLEAGMVDTIRPTWWKLQPLAASRGDCWNIDALLWPAIDGFKQVIHVIQVDREQEQEQNG